MGGFRQDLRYALRVLAKSPGFSAVAVFTLAVGIGATTAIFSAANALLLRPLPYPHPDRLVVLTGERSLGGATGGPLSWLRFQQVDPAQRSFTGVAAFTPEAFNLTGRGDPVQVVAARVSWSFFDILGIQPVQGRTFRQEEDKAGGDNVAIISSEFARSHFAGNANVPGQHLTLDSKDFTIVGVLPAGFQFGMLGPGIEIFTPRVFELNAITPPQLQAGAMYLNYLGRLRPGVSLGQARAEMDTLATEYRLDNPKLADADPGLVVRVGDLQEKLVSGFRVALLILFGAVGLVLLIACANVSSLLLSRALGRQREIAVRTAIGATRGALIRQLLTESLLLATMGGLAGAALSAWGTRALATMAKSSLTLTSEIHADGYVLAFTVAVSLGAGVVFGLAPALQASNPDLNSVLRTEGRGATAGRRHGLFRNGLVVFQVALSTILLVGAGLLLRNFVQLRTGNLGFDSRNLLTMNIALPPARYSKAAQTIGFYDEVVRQVRALPGVRSAALSAALPMNPARYSPALPEGQPAVPVAERPVFNIQALGPGFVETLRVPLVAGREFNEHDTPQTPRVIMVNQAVVHRFWPNENPIGKHILLGRQPQPSEVVGVLGDVRNNSLTADVRPEIYLPYGQFAGLVMNLVVRTNVDPHRLVAAIRGCVLAVDRDQPVTAVASMDEVMDTAASQPRFTTTLLGGLSVIALVLAMVGIYGVIAYSVAERTREMGIRMALGAERGDILHLVLRQGLVLSLSGVGLGLMASLALTRLLESLLYHVSVTDPATFIGGAALFAAVAALASYVPARRATRVDPMVALRWE